jgi:hypothetical protein
VDGCLAHLEAVAFGAEAADEVRLLLRLLGWVGELVDVVVVPELLGCFVDRSVENWGGATKMGVVSSGVRLRKTRV